MNLTAKREHERSKYDTIYRSVEPRYAQYGLKNHGSRSLEWLLAQKPLSVCDVGTGRGLYPYMLKGAGVPVVIGVDFSLPPELPEEKDRSWRDGPGIYFTSDSAHDLPLENNEVEWITSFDMMEHLVPEEVDDVLREFCRVASKGMLLSISYKKTADNKYGNDLHQTVRPCEWWVSAIERISGSRVEMWKKYLTCKL